MKKQNRFYNKKRDTWILIVVCVGLLIGYTFLFSTVFVSRRVAYEFLHPAEEIQSVSIGKLCYASDSAIQPPMESVYVVEPEFVLTTEQQEKVLKRLTEIEYSTMTGLEPASPRAGDTVIYIAYRNGDFEAIGPWGRITWEPNRQGWLSDEIGVCYNYGGAVFDTIAFKGLIQVIRNECTE